MHVWSARGCVLQAFPLSDLMHAPVSKDALQSLRLPLQPSCNLHMPDDVFSLAVFHSARPLCPRPAPLKAHSSQSAAVAARLTPRRLVLSACIELGRHYVGALSGLCSGHRGPHPQRGCGYDGARSRGRTSVYEGVAPAHAWPGRWLAALAHLLPVFARG